jgi:hypothetical protein
MDRLQTKERCLKIKDNGTGMSPQQMKLVLTSFGYNTKNSRTAPSEFNSSEHGLGLKLNAFRLGKTCVIVTRCKDMVSLGLLSQKFIEDAGQTYLVAPLVCFQVQNNTTFIPLTPYSEKLLQVIVGYTGSLFKKDFKHYVCNFMKNDGTEIFIQNLRNPTQTI